MSLPNFDHPVDWSDFTPRDARPRNESEDAHFAVTFDTNYSYTSEDGEYKMTNIVVPMVMNKRASWVVRAQQSETLRRHEQGHFDITAIGAREIHDRMQFITASSAGGLRTELSRLAREVQTIINDTNIRYDDETDHGTIVSKQNAWESNIAKVKLETSGILSDLP